LQWCDILVCVRGSELMTERIVREAKRLGRRVLYFLDDDLLHLPLDSLSGDYFSYLNNQNALRQILGMSDALWGVNERIKELYLPLCGTSRWICSRVPAVLTPPVCQDTSVTKILYAGSEDHRQIIRELIAPAVRMVATQLGTSVDFTFIGPDPQLEDLPQVHFVRFFEDYAKYRSFVQSNGFSIGLAPVRLGSFFQCKYYNKFIEYTSIGAVGIYTDSPLYRQVVTEGENGILCPNSPTHWAEAIIRLVRHQTLRHHCLANAVHLIQMEFQPDQVADCFLEQFPELRDYRAPVVSKWRVRLFSPWLEFYISRAKYLFHRFGILAVPLIGYKAVKKFVKFIQKRKRYGDH